MKHLESTFISSLFGLIALSAGTLNAFSPQLIIERLKAEAPTLLGAHLEQYTGMQPEKSLNLSDGTTVLTGSGINRYYQDPAFAIYKRKNGQAVAEFGNSDEVAKRSNPFEQLGKAYIPVDTRDTFTSTAMQLPDGSLLAAGPYNKNQVIIGKWSVSGKPDERFGQQAKTIVSLHDEAVIPGTELSTPKVITRANDGNIVVFGSFAQGREMYPFILKLDQAGNILEKHLFKDGVSMTPKQPTQQADLMNTYPTSEQAIPGIISESERLMNIYPTMTKP